MERRLRRDRNRSKQATFKNSFQCEEEEEKNKENKECFGLELREVTVNLGVKVDSKKEFDIKTKDQYFKLTNWITVDLGERVDSSNWKSIIKEPKSPKLVKRRSMRKQNSYVCENCSKVFPNRNLLDSHLADHRSERYTCSVCSLRFPLKRRLQTHMAEHH